MRDPGRAERRGDRWLQRRTGVWRLRGQARCAERTSSTDARPGLRKRLRREDGQAMVEFALVIPLLLMLVTGIFQFGTMYNKYITLTDAVRAGAETLAIERGQTDPCDPAVTQTINSATDIGLTSATVTPSFSTSTPPLADTCGTSYTYSPTGNNTGGNELQGDQATVTATAPFTLGVFGLSLFQVTLKAAASDAIQ